MNSIVDRLIDQLRKERDEIDEAIRHLEGKRVNVAEKPKRTRRRKPSSPGEHADDFAVVLRAAGNERKAKVQCKHGCGKEFGAGSHWLAKHEADCARVVKPNGSDIRRSL